ncbi:MAG: hypothetical protein LBS64_02160, partial [Spirochaetaceae bacterium]|nr:hypothetical protein [Spirochaetaceae bacterium]
MAKQQKNGNVAVGFLLQIIAAVFTVFVIIAFFDLNSVFYSRQSVFVQAAHILIGAYGFSVLLIPLFLCAAGLESFNPRWNIRRGVLLGSSALPFFTVAVTEKLCRAFFAVDTGSLLIVKCGMAILVCALLVVIEYMLTGLIFDMLQRSRAGDRGDENRMAAEPLPAEPLPVGIPQAAESTLPAAEQWGENPPDFDFNGDAAEISLEDAPAGETEPPEPEFADVERLEPDLASLPVIRVENPADAALDVTPTEVLESVIEAPVPAEPVYTPSELAELEDMSVKLDAIIAELDSLSPRKDDPAENEHFVYGENDDMEWENGDAELLLGDIPSAQAEHRVSGTAPGEPSDSDKDTGGGAAMEDDTVDAGDLFDESDTAEDVPDETDDGEPVLSYPVIAPAVTAEPAKMPPPLAAARGIYAVPTDLLMNYPDGEYWVIDNETRHAAQLLQNTLSEFKIEAEVTGIRKGPVITMFEILPAPGVKLSRIVALQDNIALRLAASSVRIVAPIPGRHAVGIEVPNKKRSIVSLREIIEQDAGEWQKMAIP